MTKPNVPKGLKGPKLSSSPAAIAKPDHRPAMLRQESVLENLPGPHAMLKARKNGDIKASLKAASVYHNGLVQAERTADAITNQMLKAEGAADAQLKALLKKVTGLRK